MKLIVFGAPFLVAGLVSASALALDSKADGVLIPDRQPAQNGQLSFSNNNVEISAKKKTKKVIPPKRAAAVRSTPATSSTRMTSNRPVYNKPLASQQPRKLLPAAISSPVTLAERRTPTAPAPKAVPANKKLYAQNTSTIAATATDANSFNGLTFPNSAAPVMKTKVAAPEDATKKNPFGFKYVDISAEYINAAESPNSASIYGPADHEVQAWDRFYVYYNANNDISLGIMGQLYHTWFGDPSRAQDASPANPTVPTNASLNQPYAAFIGDTELYLKDTKLAQPGGWKLEGVLGWYLPTSQSSQQSGQIGQSDTGISLGTSWGPVDFKYTEKLWYYFQGYQTSTLISSSDGLPDRNAQYVVWSLADATWNITSKFSFDFTMGFMNEALYPDENGARPQVLNDNIIADPELDYEFNKHFTLGLGLWEQYDMRNAAQVGTNPSVNGQPGTPIYVSQYTPFAAWNGGTQVYLTGTVKF